MSDTELPIFTLEELRLISEVFNGNISFSPKVHKELTGIMSKLATLPQKTSE